MNILKWYLIVIDILQMLLLTISLLFGETKIRLTSFFNLILFNIPVLLYLILS